MVEEEKSGCMKCMSILWQFPIFTCFFMVAVAIASVKMHSDYGYIEDEINDAFDPPLELNGSNGLLWTLIGVWIVDGFITFFSFTSSQWVYDYCCDQLMVKCAFCTQFWCYTSNWFFLLMAYVLGLVSLVITAAGGVIVVGVITVKGVCDSADGNWASIKDVLDAILGALHDYVCDKVTTGDCNFPAEIDLEDVEGFCTAIIDVKEKTNMFFTWAAILVISQWTFAMIQRANLVEGALHRDLAKRNKTDDDAQAENEMASAGGLGNV